MSIENPSAFPVPEERNSWGDGIKEGSPGMTLRDWFAGQIASGVARRGMPSSFGSDLEKWMQSIAGIAYGTADAMLLARKDAN